MDIAKNFLNSEQKEGHFYSAAADLFGSS